MFDVDDEDDTHDLSKHDLCAPACMKLQNPFNKLYCLFALFVLIAYVCVVHGRCGRSKALTLGAAVSAHAGRSVLELTEGGAAGKKEKKKQKKAKKKNKQPKTSKQNPG